MIIKIVVVIVIMCVNGGKCKEKNENTFKSSVSLRLLSCVRPWFLRCWENRICAVGEQKGSLSGISVQYQELTQRHVANCLSFDPHSWESGVQRCPLTDQPQKYVSKHWVYASSKLTLNLPLLKMNERTRSITWRDALRWMYFYWHGIPSPNIQPPSSRVNAR